MGKVKVENIDVELDGKKRLVFKVKIDDKKYVELANGRIMFGKMDEYEAVRAEKGGWLFYRPQLNYGDAFNVKAVRDLFEELVKT